MLSRIMRWLGFGGRDAQRGTSSRRTARPRSATTHLFDKRNTPEAGKPHAAASADGDFNPYNTGKFDRSASWERISKNQR